MKNVPVAVIAGDSSATSTERLERLLEFLGIPCERQRCDDASITEEIREVGEGIVFAPLKAAPRWLEAREKSRGFEKSAAPPAFFYSLGDETGSDNSLGALTGDENDNIEDVRCDGLEAIVSEEWPRLTGPLHGLRFKLTPRRGERVARLQPKGSISDIIRSEAGSHFFCCGTKAGRAFVSSSSEIPDLDQPVLGKGYNAREQFFSAAPWLMFLKWAFRGVCWETEEAGACFIVDDPLLRMNYGFCDFRLLDRQMKEHSFSTNIAMIPWNERRTSREMASLINDSEGRLSVSVHGCDHTAREFGTDDRDDLSAKVNTAKRRMAEHQKTTGIAHDSVMIFPQGIFSRESLATLQKKDFAAAVNTEPLPFARRDETLTIRDSWSVAIQRYGSFPLFTRRYPSDGIENFAFDILLGKPCLVVEHHNFFKDEHQEVVRFAKALNSLNVELHWRSLGDVIKRSYQSRIGADGVVEIRMFANELLLENREKTARAYRVEKADKGSAGVREVTADGRALEWKTDGSTLVFRCEIPPRTTMLIAVRYASPEEEKSQTRTPFNRSAKIAARRYMSEFRDNFLSRHDGLMGIAQRAKELLASVKS